ncbi:hypothetical protein SPOG_02121 [Schizosaccharomyces cryophilus OY26]|uniref:Uncharacterized protein n=1 Tax=Schizosaccharomyces cryophilus (strain OY26 / ATCC MYA-4695 / CBS 11777 / NBRC 106824 / NRRL Y48691) TaxID=653667 RepID=S9X6U3_SCHCR|nr:uncharacterized protein SPOG_02121 [Schizosaccharomyces cryophilus OY26]EPY52802.1 hypothetical protein SPOG_02121 [Schizosaccharomyces cryophilus OY26]
MDSSKMEQIRQGLLTLKWGQPPGMAKSDLQLEKQDEVEKDQKASSLVHMTKGRAHPRSRRRPKQVPQTTDTRLTRSVSHGTDYVVQKQSQMPLTKEFNGKEKDEKFDNHSEEAVVKSNQQSNTPPKISIESTVSMKNKPYSIQERRSLDIPSTISGPSNDDLLDASKEVEQKDSTQAEEEKVMEATKGNVLRNKSHFEEIDTSIPREANSVTPKEPVVHNKESGENSHSFIHIDSDGKKAAALARKLPGALSLPKQRATTNTPTRESPVDSTSSSKNHSKDLSKNPKIIQIRQRIASLQQDSASSHASLSKIRSASVSSLIATKTQDSALRSVTPQSRSDGIKVIPDRNEHSVGHGFPTKSGGSGSFASASPKELISHKSLSPKESKTPEAKETRKFQEKASTTPLTSYVPELNQFSGPSLACSQVLLARWKQEKRHYQATDSSSAKHLSSIEEKKKSTN